MQLTEDQRKILDGKSGKVLKRMMRLLVRLGEIYHAEKMIDIASVQVAGVSYKSIGDPGLDFLEDIAASGARVKTLTSLNPAGIDLRDWKELGFPEEFAKKQKRIIEAFEKMGIVTIASCTPYLAGNLPRFNEHIAWAESSAVSFANSVIGARTNREGGPSALAAALLGFTPDYGLHRDENRKPQVLVKVETTLKHSSDFGALGYRVGKTVKNKIPYFSGIISANTDNLKALGAAMAASGAVALYHIEGITPEARYVRGEGLDEIKIGPKEILETYKYLDSGHEPDMVLTGCPHASMREVISIAEKVRGKKLKKPLWICTSRMVKDGAERTGIASVITDAGGKIVADTCMVVSPIEQMSFSSAGVNSGKAANYLPGFCKKNVAFRNIDDLIESCL